MRNVGALMVVGAVGVLAGCGSSSNSDPFGPEPDYSAIRAQFDRPTGTFAAGSETGAFSAYTQSQQSGSSYSAMGNLTASSSATVTGQSMGLHILGGASSFGSAADWCPALNNKQMSGSCSCPNGGSFEWDFSGVSSVQQGQAFDVTAKAHFSACTANPVTVDGSEFLNMQGTTTSAAAAGDFYMLLDAHLTATIPPDTAKVDLDVLYENGKSWIMFTVNDGQIAVGSDGSYSGTTSTGTIYVKDRAGTWTCTATNGHGSCTSATGQTRSF